MNGRILLLAALLVLPSCMAMKGNSTQEQDYHFLFEKELYVRNAQDCMAAYYRGELLYLFTSYYNKLYKITVYDPSTGEFAELPILTDGKVSCKSLPYTYKEPRQTQWIRIATMTSPSFRQLFDNYRKEPDKLKDAIETHPFLFRDKGLWNGEKTADLTHKSIKVDTLQDIIDYFQ